MGAAPDLERLLRKYGANRGPRESSTLRWTIDSTPARHFCSISRAGCAVRDCLSRVIWS